MHNNHFVTNAQTFVNDFNVELKVAADFGFIAWTSVSHCDKPFDQLPLNMHGLYIDRRRGGHNLIEFWIEVERRKNR